MDPNATLLKMMEAVSKVIASDVPDNEPDQRYTVQERDFIHAAAELAEAVSDLNTWLTQGGHLPRAWDPDLM